MWCFTTTTPWPSHLGHLGFHHWSYPSAPHNHVRSHDGDGGCDNDGGGGGDGDEGGCGIGGGGSTNGEAGVSDCGYILVVVIAKMKKKTEIYI